MQTPISLLHNIIVNSLVVAYKIITNKKPNPQITYQQVEGRGALSIALAANAITLTAGTIAIEADEKQITIHHFDYK